MVRYIRMSSEAYGIRVLESCHAALRALGFSNLLMPATQAGFSVGVFGDGRGGEAALRLLCFPRAFKDLLERRTRSCPFNIVI